MFSVRSSKAPIASASRLLSATSLTSPSASSSSTSTRPFSCSSSVCQEVQEAVGNTQPKFVGIRSEEERRKVPAWQLLREDAILKEDIVRNMRPLGSYQTDTEWSPRSPSLNPPSAFEVSISHLVAAGTHMGHNPRLTLSAWHPYLAGRRAKMDIINVEHTLPSLRKACGLVRDIVRDDGVIVFIGRKRAVKMPMMKAVDRMGGCAHAVTSKWTPGTLTNAHVMYGPDVVLSGAHVPDLVIFLDPQSQHHILREVNLMKIPSMAITDTDVDPRIFTYPIYGNLDSQRSTELILGALGRAGEEGLAARQLRPAGGKFPLLPGTFQAKIDDRHSPEAITERQDDADQWRLSTHRPDRLDKEKRPPRA